MLRNFRFIGLDGDVVGKGFGLPGKLPRDPKPNGDRDGHFSIVLATPGGARTLRKVILTGPLKGNQLGPGTWQTAPARGPILGVVLDGKRLNPTDNAIAARLPHSSKGVRLDLYANDEGQFLPGQRFKVMVQTAALGGTLWSPSTWLAIPGGAVTITASFAGRGEDRIGNLAVANPKQPTAPSPDGLPDAHFSALLDTHGSWRIITHVVLQHIDAQGRGIGKPGSEHCRADAQQEIAANGWSALCLLLLVDGRQVELTPDWGKGPEGPAFKEPGPATRTGNLPRCAPRGDPPKPKEEGGSCMVYVPLRPSARPVRIDVYANDPDPGLAVSGQRFRLTVYFSDYIFGSTYAPPGTASATVRIG